jgi:hypothetical protein
MKLFRSGISPSKVACMYGPGKRLLADAPWQQKQNQRATLVDGQCKNFQQRQVQSIKMCIYIFYLRATCAWVSFE